MRNQKRFRAISLLEVILSVGIILIATGGIGWKVLGSIDEKRFKVELAQLRSRFLTVQKLARNMQADWEGVFIKKNGLWTFQASTVDPTYPRGFPSLTLNCSSIELDEKRQDRFTLLFFSTGEVWPQGIFVFEGRRKNQKESLNLQGLFSTSSGDGVKNLGPLHPSLEK